MDPMQSPILLAFSASLLPIIVMIAKQEHFPNNVNALIAAAVYLAVGVVAAISVSGVPDVHTIVPFIVTVTLVGKAAYDMFWSQFQTGGVSLDNRITAATTFLAPSA